MLKIGDPAPDLTLPDASGKPVRLSDFWARGPVVLFFYPKAHTMICTRQACAFRDAHGDLRAAGAAVFGVSPDGGVAQASFSAAHGFPYPLLSDVDGAAARAFGVTRFLGLMPGRATFVVARGGTLLLAYRADLRGARHAEAALAALKRIS